MGEDVLEGVRAFECVNDLAKLYFAHRENVLIIAYTTSKQIEYYSNFHERWVFCVLGYGVDALFPGAELLDDL